MKSFALVAAAASALCAFCSAAGAMSSVPFPGQNLGPKTTPQLNGSVHNDSVNNPYAYRNPFDPYLAGPNTGASPFARDRSDPEFLNVDPFDPNSLVNSVDRARYANPYPYDPIYNPYGQAPSPYAPNAPNVPMGQGAPYRR